MKDIVSRDEIRRLQKAARDNNKEKLKDWAIQYTQQLEEMIRKEYETQYHLEVNDAIGNLMIALIYSLYFSEETYIDKNNIGDFMEDLFVTIDMFRTGEYKPEEYLEILKKENVIKDIGDYNYYHLYEEKQKQLDNLIQEYTDKLNSIKNKET